VSSIAVAYCTTISFFDAKYQMFSKATIYILQYLAQDRLSSARTSSTTTATATWKTQQFDGHNFVTMYYPNF
jgi:hypothetical protein